jgi:replicative DNA helicase
MTFQTIQAAITLSSVSSLNVDGIIVSWKLESRKSLREDELLSSSSSTLDRWIMFLMLRRFMEIINELELSRSFIALNNFSITGYKSGEPQKDSLDDDYFYCSYYLHDFY